MERTFEADLDTIRRNVLRMGAEVEEMIGKSMRALTERRDDLAPAVREQDTAVDNLEIEIDEACHILLATQQPTAGDLRFVVATMKIVGDLERIGDSTKNIADGAMVLNQEPPLKPYIDLPRMAEMAAGMVRGALDAYVARDTKAAVELIKSDDHIDEIYEQLFRELLSFMIEDPKTTSRSLQLLLIAHNLERIADHATNIAEEVIYIVEGRDVRHTISQGVETSE